MRRDGYRAFLQHVTRFQMAETRGSRCWSRDTGTIARLAIETSGVRGLAIDTSGVEGFSWDAIAAQTIDIYRRGLAG